MFIWLAAASFTTLAPKYCPECRDRKYCLTVTYTQTKDLGWKICKIQHSITSACGEAKKHNGRKVRLVGMRICH